MFRNRNNQSKSPYPVSQPETTSESYEDFLERLQTLFEGEDAELFFDAIESAPARWQRKPELMLCKALGLLRAGDRDEAKKNLDEIERTHPRFTPIYFYKAGLYIEEVFPAHVLRMIDKVHALGTLDEEAEHSMGEMDKVSRQILGETAAELGVSYDKMEKASWYHEAAQEKLDLGQWASAEQMAREAIRLIPNWSSPRNNRSYVLYFMGKVSDALAEANAVLAQQPDNVHALKNLVIYYTGLGEDDKAREYLARMSTHLQTLPPDVPEVDMIISVLGLVQDEEMLWTLAQKYLKRDAEDLFDISWHFLGVAAIRGGHLKEARIMLEKSEEYYEPSKSLVIEVRKALKAGSRIVSMPVYSVLGLLLPGIIIEQLIEIIGKHLKDEQIPRHIQKKLEEFIQKRPFVITGLFRLLNEPGAAEAIPNLLLLFNQPDIDARLLAFALGDAGTNQQRLSVLSALAQMGKDIPPSPIRFWNEETSEWMDVDFTAQMLTDDFDLNISPKAAMWAQKAHDAQDDNDKIAYWRKAVEVDPKSGYAVHMLGILLIKSGQNEEGKKLARRAIEVDPDYMFAYANLSVMEAQEENPNVDVAMGYLNKVTKARVITVQTAFLMHFALMMLAFERDDFESARKEYEIAIELRPDDPMLGDWDTRLKFGELFAGGWLAKWQEESRQRSHNKAIRTKLENDSDATVTLNSLTREPLGTVARIWGLTAYGKKAELINKIAERMQDAVTIKYVWGNLNEAEQNALRWVLENDGVRDWKDFTEKHGDDAGESAHWNYHEPKSVIGRLRQSGFIALGTLNGEQVVFIPVELRSSLNITMN